MKFLVALLLVVAGVTASAQTYIDFRKPMRLLYGGDTLIISLQGNSVIFSGKAAELVLRDSTLLEIIKEHGGAGGYLPAGNGLYIENDTIKLGGGAKIKDNTAIGVQHNVIRYYDSEYQKGIYIYVSKEPAGSAQSVSSIQVKTDYNPTLSPYERLDSSTYIKFTGFHCPTGSDGLYAESRFNEFGFSYNDTLAGRNKNNQRWIPDKAYVDSVSNKVTITSGSLTDGLPTAAEINTVTGLTPATATAGYQVTIKDSDGTGLLYKIESDGTDWYYTAMTKAL